MEPKQREFELAAAKLGLASNVYDFNSHARRVQALQGATSQVGQLEEARQQFCSLLPMTDGKFV